MDAFWNNFTSMPIPKQSHKPRKKSARKSKSAKVSISFRFTKSALDDLRKAAEDDGRTLQNFMDHRVVPNAHKLVGLAGDLPKLAA